MGETNYPLLVGVGSLLITVVLWSKLRKLNDVAPGEPPMLPGALPIVGHAISLVRDASSLHAYARLVVSKSRNKVADIMADVGSGRQIYVLYRCPWWANAPTYVRVSRLSGNSLSNARA
jgi:hypothetical protein